MLEHHPLKLVSRVCFAAGEVFLDKVGAARTVLCKVGQIENVYRVFEQELLAGDDDMIVTVKEWDNWFTFDFSKAFWNPRLSAYQLQLSQIRTYASSTHTPNANLSCSKSNTLFQPE